MANPNDAPPPTPAPSFAAASEWVRPMVAAQLAGGVSRRTIARWVALGYLRSGRPAGGVRLIESASLLRFIESAAVLGEPTPR